MNILAAQEIEYLQICFLFSAGITKFCCLNKPSGISDGEEMEKHKYSCNVFGDL